MKRKLIAAALAVCLAVISAAPAAGAYTESRPRGSDYTDIPALASRLDTVFSGAPALYSDITCKSPVAASIGSAAVPPGRTLYVRDILGNVYSGSSCYIYANAVYSTLFGDIPYHGEPGSWQCSQRVLKNAAAASFSLFVSSGVECGALLRTTSNSDGSYNSDRGHSVIILKYDQSGVTYLEGNGDGKGFVRVTTRDWSGFNSTCVSGRGYRISFIVQPTPAAYQALRSAGTYAAPQYVGYFRKSTSTVFRDVAPSAWYASGVDTVCGVGLMDGSGENIFSPSGAVTGAEAVTLTARFLSRYYDDRHVFAGGGSWYAPYYAYCALWGIDMSFASPNEPINRADFARLMDRALPEAARTASASDPGFPDVPASAPWAGPVISLARTGVIRGGDGLYCPTATLTRAEAACILARMADISLR